MNELYTAANAELGMRDKATKLHSRLDRVQKFLAYLKEEEEIERELYAKGEEEELISTDLLECFESERKRVLTSAKKWIGVNPVNQPQEWENHDRN